MNSVLENLSLAVIIVYLLLVVGLGIFGLITLAVLHKHAEKKSLATGISIVFVILFTIIFLVSLKALSNI